MSKRYSDQHTALLDAAIALDAGGIIGAGTSGNLSVRTDEGYLITPTGLPYYAMQTSDLVLMDAQGTVISGERQPSSEWRFHQAIYQARKEMNAIVHTHSDYATALSCTRQPIPSFHYMVAVAGGDSIRCAEYATFGTTELADNAVRALKDRLACLLANHGMLALGVDINQASQLAETIEQLAKQYWLARQTGNVVLLDEAEMRVNLEKFKTYGKHNR